MMARIATAVVGAVLVVAAACSSSAKDTVNQAGARAAAEAMRAQLKANNVGNGQTVRTVAVLRAAARNIPGSPTVEGITDADNDGKDDDGKVTITVGGQSACLTANDNGSVDVTDNAC